MFNTGLIDKIDFHSSKEVALVVMKKCKVGVYTTITHTLGSSSALILTNMNMEKPSLPYELSCSIILY